MSLLLVILNPEFARVFLTMSGVMVVNRHFRRRPTTSGKPTVFSLYWQKFIEGGTCENRLGLNEGRGEGAGEAVYNNDPVCNNVRISYL